MALFEDFILFLLYLLRFSLVQEKMNERLREYERKMKKTEKLDDFEDSS